MLYILGGCDMAYIIYHYKDRVRYDFGRADDISELHQMFRNILVVYGGRLDPRNLTLSYPDGSFYFAYRQETP